MTKFLVTILMACCWGLSASAQSPNASLHDGSFLVAPARAQVDVGMVHWLVGGRAVAPVEVAGWRIEPGILHVVDLASCPADLNHDNVVSTVDLLMILSEFGCTQDCGADLNGDGAVGTSDLLILLSYFGTIC